MKCQACNIEVSEKLKASISANFCPFCGEKLMSPDILRLKSAISHSIVRISSDGNKNLDTPDRIEAFASLLAVDLSKYIYSSGEIYHSDPIVVPTALSAPVEVKDGRAVVPEYLKPVNKKPPKAISRGNGEPLSSISPFENVETAEMSLNDLKNLEASLEGDVIEESLSTESTFSDIEDSEFFNSGSIGDGTIHEVEGENVMFGVSDSALKEKANFLKQKHAEIKKRGGLKLNRPVSRAG